MQHHGHAICRRSHVCFHIAVTQCDGVLESGPTVLGGFGRPATVGERDRAGVVQEGKRGRHCPPNVYGRKEPHSSRAGTG